MLTRFRLPRLLPLTILALGAGLCLHVAALFGAFSDGETPRDPGLIAPAAAAPASQPAAPAQAPPAPAPAPAPGPVAAAPPPAGPPSQTQALPPAEPQVMQDLRARRRELDAREAALNARAAALDAAERALQTRVQEMTALQKRLEALDDTRRTRGEAEWQGLVKMYEAMRPSDAAVIFNDLDMQVLLQVMDRMKERKAAPILAAMQPERARQVTEQLAALRAHRTEVAPAATGPGGTTP